MLVSVAVRAFASFGYSLKRSSELTRLADIHGSDKGYRKAAHAYTRVYEQLFAPLRAAPIVLLEIGLGERNAPSLQMWRRYLGAARIFGFDMEDYSHLRLDRCAIVRGDMANPDDLDRLIAAIGAPIDVIIDDGSHAAHDQQVALGALFPHLKPGGLYAIEDLHWRPAGEPADVLTTRELLRRFRHAPTLEGAAMPAPERAYLEAHIADVRLYDSMTSTRPDASDALGVLTKKIA